MLSLAVILPALFFLPGLAYVAGVKLGTRDTVLRRRPATRLPAGLAIIVIWISVIAHFLGLIVLEIGGQLLPDLAQPYPRLPLDAQTGSAFGGEDALRILFYVNTLAAIAAALGYLQTRRDATKPPQAGEFRTPTLGLLATIDADASDDRLVAYVYLIDREDTTARRHGGLVGGVSQVAFDSEMELERITLYDPRPFARIEEDDETVIQESEVIRASPDEDRSQNHIPIPAIVDIEPSRVDYVVYALHTAVTEVDAEPLETTDPEAVAPKS